MTEPSAIKRKIVLLGAVGTGKTCLVQKYVNNLFVANQYATIGMAYVTKSVELRGSRVMLCFWDTAGQERYAPMCQSFIRGSAAAIVCYDITWMQSYTEATKWAHTIRDIEPDCPIYFCGTKRDTLFGEDKKERQVDYRDVCNMAEPMDRAKVIETSSKTGENVEELFSMIVEDFLNDPALKQSHDITDQFQLEDFAPAKSRSFCRC